MASLGKIERAWWDDGAGSLYLKWTPVDNAYYYYIRYYQDGEFYGTGFITGGTIDVPGDSVQFYYEDGVRKRYVLTASIFAMANAGYDDGEPTFTEDSYPPGETPSQPEEPPKYQFAHGDGTEENPYEIWTVEDLNGIREYALEEAYFKQMADIDLSEHADWNPIGKDLYDELTQVSSKYNFYGHYKGQGYRISRMTITQGAVAEIIPGSYMLLTGLFGYMRGSLDGINLVDYDINLVSAAYARVNALTMGNSGTITRCSAQGVIDTSAVTSAFISGIAVSEGQIENCFSNFSFNASSSDDIISGISYQHSASLQHIFNCYTIAIPMEENEGIFIGVGPAEEDMANTNYYNSDLATINPTHSTGYGIPKTTAEMKQQSTYEGWDFDTVWGIDPAINEGYPYLRMFESESYDFQYGSGTEADPYQIWTAEDFNGIRDYVIDTNNPPEDARITYYIQMAHINLADYSDWLPLSYKGATYPEAYGLMADYNGNGFRFANVFASGGTSWSDPYTGETYRLISLFGLIAVGDVYGVGIDGYSFNAAECDRAFVHPVAYIGAGKMYQCWTKGTVDTTSVEDAFVSGIGFVGYSLVKVDGEYQISGLGIIENCYAIGKHIGKPSLPDPRFINGLAGISIMYDSTQSITKNCYSIYDNSESGTVVSLGISYNPYEEADDTRNTSYYNADICVASPENADYDGIPKTTVEMKQKETYENWDFEEVWNINPTINDGYPYLRTEKIDIDIPTSPILELLKDIELLSHRTHLYISEEQKINLATKYGIGSLIVASGIYPETLIELDSLVNSYWEHTTKDIKLKWKQILYTNINGYIKLDNIIINDMFNYLTNEELIIGDLIQLQDNLIIPIPPLPVIEWTPSWVNGLYEELKETDDETLINDGLVEWDWYVTMDDELYKVLKNNPSLDETDEFLEASDVLSLIKKINNAIKPMN